MPRFQEKIRDERGFTQSLADKLRHTARNPDISRYVPHPKQLLFHGSQKPGRQLIGGNRSGKTVGGGTEVVWYATGTHPYKRLPWAPPLRLRVVTTDLVEGLEKIVLPEIKKWMPTSYLINGSWEDSYSKQFRTLTLNNGSFIEFLTYEQEVVKFAGTSRHGIWFDEEPPKNIYTECKLRLVDTEGHWWMTMTPVEGMTWTFDEIYEKHDPYIEVIEVDMDDNPYLSEMGKAIALSGLSKEDIEARKHGRYVSMGGVIYQSVFDLSRHLLEPFDFDDFESLPREGVMHFASMDHGFTNPTAWLWGYVDENGRIVIYDEWYQSGMLVHEHARKVQYREASHRVHPQYRVGDPSIRNKDPITGTSVQIEYIEHGIPIGLANNDVHAGIDKVKRMFVTDKLFITKNCTNLIWEMKRYRWATWKGSKDQYEKNKKEDPQKKDDHACDAMRYLVASRPEVEDLRTTPPVPQNVINAPVGIDPDQPYFDKEVVKASKANQHDFNLGDDW